MPLLGSPIGRRPFLEEVQVVADFLNLTTLKRRRWTNLVGITRIGFFLIVTGMSLNLGFWVFARSYWESQDSYSMKYLSYTFFGSWLIILYNLIEFSCSMDKLRRVVAIVTKVDLFLMRSVKPKKSRVSYFQTMMVLKYLFITGLSSLIDLLFHGPHNSYTWILVTQAGILTWSFLLDICIRKFTVMVHFIERRFKVLEDLLKETWIRRNKGWEQDVKTLIQAHDLLCDACVVLNSAWRRPLVTLVWLIFVRLVHGAVKASIEIKRQGFNPLLTLELACVYEITYWMWNLYDITHYTQQCESQVKGFNSTLYCLVMSKTQIIRGAESDLVDTLLIQLGRKRMVVFTAHGMFPINNTLVHSVLAGVFTTVIIILQADSLKSE